MKFKIWAVGPCLLPIDFDVTAKIDVLNTAPHGASIGVHLRMMSTENREDAATDIDRYPFDVFFDLTPIRESLSRWPSRRILRNPS